mmetsp:Transcript_28802/g.62201  ORF Transcript_28802/g.62201 Transcript_28802/m.62201 type:complete len:80 (+) Transcript_28802:367-606(+)
MGERLVNYTKHAGLHTLSRNRFCVGSRVKLAHLSPLNKKKRNGSPTAELSSRRATTSLGFTQRSVASPLDRDRGAYTPI